MRNHTIRPRHAGYAVACLAFLVCSDAAIVAAERPSQKMLTHDVYFCLKDKSVGAKNELVAGCKKYLADHAGTVWFAAGVIVADHQRDVNDRGFDVALHIVFKDKASHDKYQKAPQHHKFIEEYKDNWESVRVFDSWVEVSAHAEQRAAGSQ